MWGMLGGGGVGLVGRSRNQCWPLGGKRGVPGPLGQDVQGARVLGPE